MVNLRNRETQTILSGILLVAAGSWYLVNELGYSDVKIYEIIATACIFAGVSILASMIVFKLFKGVRGVID